MKVLAWEELAGDRPRGEPMAAAVGVFDGLHLGHMRLMNEVLSTENLARGVVTFRDNPKKVLRPSEFRGDIFTLDQKLEALAGLGLDICVLIDFSGDFSKLAGRKFLSLLRDRGNLRFLALGSDFRCGHRLDTDARGIQGFLGEQGVETRLLEALAIGGRPVSSSRIRRAIEEGRLEEAASLLGRSYELDLRRSRILSPVGDLRIEAPAGQVRPPRGSYEAALAVEGGYTDTRATFDGGAWVIEGQSAGLPLSPGPRALRLMKLVSRV